MFATLSLAAFLISQAPKPNIIYIMADDLGYRELGCFGQKKIPTPYIDRLAAEGMVLTRTYSASPVCAPTRCSLLTGKHQGHAAIRGNKELGGFGPNDKEGQMPLPLSEVTVAELLKSSGYRTGLVGKWGLGGTGVGEVPTDHGFDFFYGYLCQRRAHNYYPAYLWNGRDVDLLNNAVYSAHQKIAEPLETEAEYEQRYGGNSYSATKLYEACKAFIGRKSDEPFFLYFAPTLPHVALQAPREWVDKFPRDWDTKPYLGEDGYLPNARPRATYAAMIAYLDFSVGEIMSALEKAGKANNTLIIFTSDNGATNVGGVDRDFFESNGELRDGKMSLYEGGIRVPMVARWPGRIPARSRSDSVIVCFDMLATLCEAASVKAPKTDGVSYLPSLLGNQREKREYVYFEYPEASAMQAVIFGNLKVIRPDLKKNPSRVEVYDLASDPGEKNNISAARPELVAKALEVMKREHRPNKNFPLGVLDRTEAVR